jgi:hypothetical protein
MSLPDNALREIDLLVRGGFDEPHQIDTIVAEELYEPGQLDPVEVRAAVRAAASALRKSKAAWPAVTDCDKLDEVFDSLNRLGIVALQNAGYTQSDGYEDIRQAFHQHGNKESVIGFCFYHRQDLNRVIESGDLYLAFGPIDPKREETDGPRIGAMIVDVLKAAGLSVEWNGAFGQRILVKNFDWKRR